MADSKHANLVTKLDRNFLECGICLDRFRQPRGLPCLHSFCQVCLEKYCQGQKLILCPNCKTATTLPKEGVAGLPAHFMVNSLQQTLDMEKLQVILSKTVGSFVLIHVFIKKKKCISKFQIIQTKTNNNKKKSGTILTIWTIGIPKYTDTVVLHLTTFVK